MPLTRRLAAVTVTAAAFAGSLLAAPPAQAQGSYDCFSGSRTPAQGAVYELTANGCAGGGYADVVIKIMVGPAAGLHRCGWIFTWNGDLSGHDCRAE